MTNRNYLSKDGDFGSPRFCTFMRNLGPPHLHSWHCRCLGCLGLQQWQALPMVWAVGDNARQYL